MLNYIIYRWWEVDIYSQVDIYRHLRKVDIFRHLLDAFLKDKFFYVIKWTASSEFGTYRLCEQWVKRNLQTESQIPESSEWLGMRS